MASGIWSAPTAASSDVPREHRLTLGEGGTPLQPWSGGRGILLKREDLQPTGSHKDRAAAYQVAAAAGRGAPAVTISSSGNAAVATSRYAARHGLPAFVFVHPDTDPAKLASIDGTTTTIVITRRAINGAKLVARELQIPNLRPSTNDDALVGYASLGEELAAELPADIDAVVLFATSGATAVAVARILARARPGIEVHFVQGEGNATLADPSAAVTDDSARAAAAGRLGVRRSRRAQELASAIAATGGRGHVASDQDIIDGRGALDQSGIAVSEESAANIAVAIRLSAAGRSVCCIVSGAPPGPGACAAARIVAQDEHVALEEVRMALAARGMCP